MKKYRIKTPDGEILGPFEESDFFKFFEQGLITGREQYQEFPLGEWGNLSDNETLISRFTLEVNKIKEAKKKDSEAPKNEEFEEYKFSRDKKNEPTLFVERKSDENDDEIGDEGAERLRTLDQTIVKNGQSNLFLDETRLVEGYQKSELHDAEPSKPLNLVSPKESPQKNMALVIDPTDETKVVDVNELLNEVREKAVENEIELFRNESKKQEKESDMAEEQPEKVVPRKMKPVVFLTFLVLIWFILFDDDKPADAGPVPINVNFPTISETIDSVKSRDFFEKGLAHFRSPGYQNKILSLVNFTASLENHFEGNKALSYLIYLYGELYENVPPGQENYKNLLKLLRFTSAKLLSDELVATGTGLLYFKLGKKEAAERILNNYIRVNNQASSIFYASYLRVLTRLGNIEGSKKISLKLEELKNKSIYMVVALAEYYFYNDQDESLKELFRENKELYKSDSQFLLTYGMYLLRLREFDLLEDVLKVVRIQAADQSPYLYSLFVELQGAFFAYKGKVQEASKLFESALKINPRNDRLKTMLANLEIGADKLTDSLILESKVDIAIQKSIVAIRKQDWKSATELAFRATFIDPESIPAQIHLSNLQIRRGYIELAIKTLEDLEKRYSMHPKVLFLLLKAYIDSFHFSKATKLISIIKKSSFALLPEYSSILGYYYLKRDNFAASIRAFKMAINKNELDDQNFYWLSQMLFSHGQITEALKSINKAIDIDPLSIDYTVFKSRIIREIDGGEIAVGHLLNELKKEPDSAKILGEIAINYFDMQQMDLYKDAKKKLESLENKTGELYEYLLNASMQEGNLKAAIGHGEKLINVEPGKLEMYVTLGKIFLDLGKQEQAVEKFRQVELRLEAYPRIHYYMAKAYIDMNLFADAEKEALKEIKFNSDLENGHFILGEIQRLQKDYENAEKNIDKAIQIAPEYYDALISSAWIKRNKRDYDNALELLFRARKVNEKNPLAYVELGHIYRMIGQATIAIENYGTYLRLRPGAPDQKEVENYINTLKY